MDKYRRFVVVASVLVAGSALLAVPFGAAHASEPNTLYVQSMSGCSDAGSGSQAVPYCNVQAAADVVLPGQTIEVLSTGALLNLTLTRSGTPAEPITIRNDGSATLPPLGSISLSGVHDVVLRNLAVDFATNADAIDVVGSQDITLDHFGMSQYGAASTTNAAVDIDGASSHVTVSRFGLVSSFGYDVRIHAGAQHITVTRDQFLGNAKIAGVDASGVSDLAVTGNTIHMACGPGIAVEQNGSATIENTVISESNSGSCTTSPAISVADDSTAGVTTDYNAILVAGARSRYQWGASSYPTAATFQAATGQGSHDIDLTTGTLFGMPAENSPLIDSGDASAPGEPATDLSGRAVEDDPLVTNTGTGAGTTDRGAFERMDTITPPATVAPTLGVAPLAVGVSGTASSTWSEPLTTTVDFGDGSGPQPYPDGGLSHSYTTPGPYDATVRTTDGIGTPVVSRTTHVIVATPAAPVPQLTAGPDVVTNNPALPTMISTNYARFTLSSSDPWEVTQQSVDFGDGSSQSLGGNATAAYHQYWPGTYTATLTATDVLGRTSTASATVVVGDGFFAVQPQAIYDSRNGSIDTIAAHATVSIPVGAYMGTFNDGVALDVTVLNPKNSGDVRVSPAGSATGVATVSFGTGQTAEAQVTVAEPGFNRFVNLVNESAGPIDLKVDIVGVYGASEHTYATIAPKRILDTGRSVLRVVGAPRGPFHIGVRAGKSFTLTVGGVGGVPTNVGAVELNIQTTNTRGSGALTVTAPNLVATASIQNVVWSNGQILSNQLTVPVSNGQIVLRNDGPGTADFVVDVVGYYAYGMMSVFMPAAPSQIAHGVTIAPNGTLKVNVAGRAGVPTTGVTAAQISVTTSGAGLPGYLVVSAGGSTGSYAPLTLVPAGRTQSNPILTPLDGVGSFVIYNGSRGAVTISIDLDGTYYMYPTS